MQTRRHSGNPTNSLRDGVIPETHVTRLKEIGDWLAKYGESIYGTRPGPFPPVDGQYGATYRETTVYLHILNWPQSLAGRRGTLPSAGPASQPDTIRPPALKQKISAVRVLTTSAKATFTQSDSQVVITLPIEQRDPLDTIIAFNCNTKIEP